MGKQDSESLVERVSEFVCRCDGGDAEVDAMRQRAIDYLNTGAGWALPNLVEYRGLVSMAVQTLHERWLIDVNDIGVDQWFAISAERRDWGSKRETWIDDNPPLLATYWIQCDLVEDGFAWLVMHLAEGDTNE